MRKVTITRDETSLESGTFGRLKTDSGFECDTLERPTEGPHPCIPAGSYQVQKKPHPIHGNCYEVLDVPGRTAILLHSANWYQQLLGCVALGRAIGEVEGYWEDSAIKQKGVVSSKDAIKGFEDDLNGESFNLRIEWA